MEIIRKYFPNLTPEQERMFSMLGGLYCEWNSKINVISRKDADHLYERHILHSLGLAKIIRFKEGTYVLDVGTGGGFPGIPLAVFFPEVHFTLIDSIGKKIKVVNEVAKALGLNNVEARHQRVQEVNEKFDFVVSRAVTALPAFLEMTQCLIRRDEINFLNNGILYLKGGDFSEELYELDRRTHVYYLSNYFYEDFFDTKKIVHIY
ncbi:MAG: 16S rRNA (guanine(527)-N(7))-methyltransferase RsmG [Bacteroidales bacterium]|jgi:16S rRNA (guanine527-N7)-methyltransferase|nr:16S rRNA (guanine(527)-N(7))-methyltransferase RsmG [Bacteroidales bacterium]